MKRSLRALVRRAAADMWPALACAAALALLSMFVHIILHRSKTKRMPSVATSYSRRVAARSASTSTLTRGEPEEVNAAAAQTGTSKAGAASSATGELCRAVSSCVTSSVTGSADVAANGPATLLSADVADRSCRTAPATSADTPGLSELRAIWLEEIRPRFLPGVALDPFLSPPDVNDVLRRFLDADRGSVQLAAERLERTAEFRKEYDCVAYHRQGMARKLWMHASNAGACVYFGDFGLRNQAGLPVLVGRTSLMVEERAPHRKPSDKMLAAQHLRGALLVFERSSVEMIQHGNGSKGMYICDVGGYPTEEMAPFKDRYWDADGPPAAEGVLPCVDPVLPGHHDLRGLGVLREAVRILERYYPETLGRVFFYRPGAGFRFIFAIFSMWVGASTRSRFVLVRKGEESRYFFSPPPHGCGLRPEDTPPELGGSGPSMQGDRFLLKAMEKYDREATLPP